MSITILREAIEARKRKHEIAMQIAMRQAQDDVFRAMRDTGEPHALCMCRKFRWIHVPGLSRECL